MDKCDICRVEGKDTKLCTIVEPDKPSCTMRLCDKCGQLVHKIYYPKKELENDS